MEIIVHSTLLILLKIKKKVLFQYLSSIPMIVIFLIKKGHLFMS